jgi:single-strand DNA-binding protein
MKMSSFNKVIELGNIVRDPEIKYSANGVAIANFTLAVNNRYKKGDEMKEDVVYVDVTCFNKQAESVGEYCQKGDTVLIDGRLTQSNWEDRETGQKRSKLGVTAQLVNFIKLQKKSDGAPKAGSHDTPPVDDGNVPF